MKKTEKYIDYSAREALKPQNGRIAIISTDELEELIERTIYRALEKNKSPSEILPEYGDITLAENLTGYKRQTIYQMVCTHKIPFNKKHGKLFFCKQDLLKWLQEGRRETIEELSKKISVGKM